MTEVRSMIELRDIRKSFARPDGGRLEVLKGIDCEISAGEFVAVVGPSGSGKSTLMNILGLLDQPDGGSYLLGGQPVERETPRARARLRNRSIGFVFQQFHLLPRTTAVENVELPLIYSDAEGGHSEDRAVEVLCQVGLEDRLGHYPSELSGGQQQRVAIARALVTDPELILADEPTGNLDSEASEEIMQLLLALHRAGRTIVLITHDRDLAARCTSIRRIHDGRLVARHEES
jgi:ABC-type lipoprotein export system ATPase subunit